MNPTVQNRESYLSFVTDWKDAYKILSGAIRTIKFCDRFLQSKRFEADWPELQQKRDKACAQFILVRNKCLEANKSSVSHAWAQAFKWTDEQAAKTVILINAWTGPSNLATWMLNLRRFWRKMAGIAAQKAFEARREPAAVAA